MPDFSVNKSEQKITVQVCGHWPYNLGLNFTYVDGKYTYNKTSTELLMEIDRHIS